MPSRIKQKQKIAYDKNVKIKWKLKKLFQIYFFSIVKFSMLPFTRIIFQLCSYHLGLKLKYFWVFVFKTKNLIFNSQLLNTNNFFFLGKKWLLSSHVNSFWRRLWSRKVVQVNQHFEITVHKFHKVLRNQNSKHNNY